MSTETEPLPPPADKPASQDCCRKTGYFIAKGECFALHDPDGLDAWLDIAPVPLHLLDQEVEIVGRQYSDGHILVTAIGPIHYWA